MACRVVCGRLDVIAILEPTSALVSVDLPALGRPTKHANPDRNPSPTCANPLIAGLPSRRERHSGAIGVRRVPFAQSEAASRRAGASR